MILSIDLVDKIRHTLLDALRRIPMSCNLTKNLGDHMATIIENVETFFRNTIDRVEKALPEITLAGVAGAVFAAAGTAFKVNCFVFNPLAAGIFCAATHLLRKTVAEPFCAKFVNVKKLHPDFKTLAPFVGALALSNYAIGVLAPVMAVEIARGSVTYVASLLALSLLQ